MASDPVTAERLDSAAHLKVIHNACGPALPAPRVRFKTRAAGVTGDFGKREASRDAPAFLPVLLRDGPELEQYAQRGNERQRLIQHGMMPGFG